MIRFPSKPCITEHDLPSPDCFCSFHPFLKGVFSQWHDTPFTIDGTTYTCAEQDMMAAKAALFGADDIATQIMDVSDPAVHKRLGAQLVGFRQEGWDHWRFHIVYTANHAKFSQNSGACRQLNNTAPAMLVEANPRDWNWGNGLQIDDPSNHDPGKWRGTNFLGRILTLIRSELSGHE